MKGLRTLFLAFALSILLSLLLTTPASGQDPHLQPNDSWITVSGTVETVERDWFMLRYDDDPFNTIIVEMDDGDRDADGYQLISGDPVTVTGVIDDDLFETRSIEASSVYVENIDTHFFASAVDEESLPLRPAYPVPMGEVMISGRVSDVRSDEFVLDTGFKDVTVEVERMSYDPLDDIGYQKLETGDLVRVRGKLNYDFLEGREIYASSVTTLRSIR